MNKMKKKEQTGYLQVFAAGALWGGIGVFVTAMGAHGSTGSLTSFLRMFFSFLILAVITAMRFGLRAFRVDKRTLLHCALLGLVCQGIYNVFYSFAITKAGVTASAVLLNVAPVVTALAARLMFAEKITKKGRRADNERGGLYFCCNRGAIFLWKYYPCPAFCLARARAVAMR